VIRLTLNASKVLIVVVLLLLDAVYCVVYKTFERGCGIKQSQTEI